MSLLASSLAPSLSPPFQISQSSHLLLPPLSLSFSSSPRRRIAAAVTNSEAAAAATTPAIAKEVKLEPEIGGGGGSGGESGGGGGEGSGGGGGGRGGGGEEEEEEEEEEGKKKMEEGGLSMSQKLTLGYAALVGVGGAMGYMKSGSQKSLAAGGISALALYYVHTQLPVRPVFASSIGLGVSGALLAVMGSRFKKSGKIFPAGVVSLVSLIMVGGYFHGILRSSHA